MFPAGKQFVCRSFLCWKDRTFCCSIALDRYVGTAWVPLTIRTFCSIRSAHPSNKYNHSLLTHSPFFVLLGLITPANERLKLKAKITSHDPISWKSKGNCFSLESFVFLAGHSELRRLRKCCPNRYFQGISLSGMLKFHLQQKSYLLKRLIHKVKTRCEKHNSWTMNVLIIDRWIEWSEWNLLFVFQYLVKWVSQFMSLETLFFGETFHLKLFFHYSPPLWEQTIVTEPKRAKSLNRTLFELVYKKKNDIATTNIQFNKRKKEHPYELVSETCLKWNLGLQIQPRWTEVERTV